MYMHSIHNAQHSAPDNTLVISLALLQTELQLYSSLKCQQMTCSAQSHICEPMQHLTCLHELCNQYVQDTCTTSYAVTAINNSSAHIPYSVGQWCTHHSLRPALTPLHV